MNRHAPIRAVVGAWIAALLAPWTMAGPVTFPACENPPRGASDCFTVVKGIPGCRNRECCNAICALDDSCCTSHWAGDCVAMAMILKCDPPPLCPGKGSCLEPHDTPSCEDLDCCNLLCRIDAFCCYYLWDQLCVDQAQQLCGIPACTIVHPPGVPDEPENCGQRLNDGCNLDVPTFTPITCGQSYFGQTFAYPPRDTDWYRVVVSTPRQLVWTVTPEFPAQLLILEGSCTPSIRILAQSFARNCQPQSLSLCVQPGTYFLFVSPGDDAGPLYTDMVCPGTPNTEPPFYGMHYLSALTCNGCPGSMPADFNHDGHVNGLDLALLLGTWGACPVSGPCLADLNFNDVVNGIDLALLLGSWG